MHCRIGNVLLKAQGNKRPYIFYMSFKVSTNGEDKSGEVKTSVSTIICQAVWN